MNPVIRILIVAVSCLLIPAGCKRAPDAELEKARADAEKAKAELAKLKESPEQPQAEKTAGTPSAPQSAPAAGPVVFDNPLFVPDALDSMFLSYGQYGSRASVQAGQGLKLGGGHTSPAVWAKPYLGDNYNLQFETQLGDKGWAGWILSGSGSGNSDNSGYGCKLETNRFVLSREGVEVQSIELPKVIAPEEWSSVQAEVKAGKVAVSVNGVPVAKFSDSQPLMGPLHGWFGLFGPTSSVLFRNLKVWSASTETNRERQLTPTVTEKPAANGAVLYELKMQRGELAADWWKSQPQNARIKGNVVDLSGPNGAPDVILKQPLTGNVACEAEFEYPTDEAVNFSMMLWYAEQAPETIQNTGWMVGLPNGDGTSGIRWQTGEEKGEGVWARSQVLASTPYYAPIARRKYVARVEMHGSELWVFLDGGLLLKAQRPAESPAPTTPAFFGMRQIYGGSLVHAVRIYQIGP